MFGVRACLNGEGDMNVARVVLVYLLFAIIFAALPLLAGEPANTGKGAPLSRFLNPDGSLCLPPEGIPLLPGEAA